MFMESYTIRFPESEYQPLTLMEGQKLSEQLTVVNSPVMFGCRTGICGTCLVFVIGETTEPSAMEQEVLEITVSSHIPANMQPRLACQLEVTDDIAIYSHISMEDDK
jgi:ferredoxin